MNVSLSQKTIVILLFSLVAVYFLWWVRSLILILIFSYTFASAFRSLGLKISEKTGLNKTFSFSFVFFLLVSIALFSFWILFPFVNNEINQFVRNFPGDFFNFLLKLNKGNPELINSSFEKLLLKAVSFSIDNLANFTLNSLNILFNIFLVLILTFYILVDYDKILKSPFLRLLPNYERIKILETRVQKRLGRWALVQILLSLLTGVVLGFGLGLIGVHYALSLTLITIVANFIPVIGSFIALVIVFFIALVQNPILALWVFLAYNAAGLFKDNFLSVKLIHFFGFTPLSILLFFIVGVTLFGFLGALVSVPLLVIFSVVVEEIEKENRFRENSEV